MSVTSTNQNYLWTTYSWNRTGTVPVYGQALTISYTYLNSLPLYYSEEPSRNDPTLFRGISSGIAQWLDFARTQWSGVSNITWQNSLQTSGVIGQITFGYYPMVGVNTAGDAVLPDASNATQGDIFFNTRGTYASDLLSPVGGTFGFWTALHELGHALGLDHSANVNATEEILETSSVVPVPEAERSWRYTVMTYSRDVSGLYPITPMIHDIAAMQRLYGASIFANGGSLS